MDNRGKMVDSRDDMDPIMLGIGSFDSSLETGMETLMENQISTGSSSIKPRLTNKIVIF